jgi:hypothetical protein
MKEVWKKMVKTIVTGPYPGQPGACIAQYNHHSYQHSSPPKSTQQQQLPLPNIQLPYSSFQAQYGNSPWRPPGNSFPYYY